MGTNFKSIFKYLSVEKGTQRCWGAQGPRTLGCGLGEKSCSQDFYEGRMMKSRGSGRLPCEVIIKLRMVRKQGHPQGKGCVPSRGNGTCKGSAEWEGLRCRSRPREKAVLVFNIGAMGNQECGWQKWGQEK